MSKPQPFRPRARLLLQLGDQLIRNESVALLELAKNSYDAGAHFARVELFQAGDSEEGYIVITDDGHGMDEQLVKKVWLEPGTDYQVQQLSNIEREEDDTAHGSRPKISDVRRKPLGEKGIGRFAAHKLGYQMEIVSKKAGRQEITFNVDWKAIERIDYLHKVRVKVDKSTKPKIFTDGGTGTRISIRGLRHTWSRAEIRELYRSAVAMCSPFQKPDSFRIEFRTDNQDDLKNLPNHEEILEQALYSFDCTVRGDHIIRFRYTFQPFEGMTRVKPREIVFPAPARSAGKTHTKPIEPIIDPFFEKSRRLVKQVKDEETGEKVLEPVNLATVGVGDVRFHGYAFDREPKTLNLGALEPTTVREYLEKNGGVRVYRDGVRVYDYGEPGNDWLDLQARRVARPGVKLDSKLLVAAVELDRGSSKPLVEKTNREGFIENDAYHTLVDVVLQCLDRVENYRYEDKERIRLNYGVSNRKDRIPLTDRLSEARDLIEQKVTNASDQKALVTALTRVEDDYEFISKTLLTSAGAGMQLSLAVHEIDKIVDELVAFVGRDTVPARVRELVRRLSQLVEGYSAILRRGKKRRVDLTSVIREALFFVEYRLQVHDIEVVHAFKHFKGDPQVNCIGNLITTGILNLIDNSIFWLDYAKISRKRILVDLLLTSEGEVSLIVADNGAGFNLPADVMIRPFVSKRPKGSGLGLYLLDEIMTIHGGTLSFPEPSKLKLPADFKNGAVAALTFAKHTLK